jgi:hypothetical protein
MVTVEPGRAGRVWVYVGGELEALGARALLEALQGRPMTSFETATRES